MVMMAELVESRPWRLCVSMGGGAESGEWGGVEDVLRGMRAAKEEGADVVELRLDSLSPASPSVAASHLPHLLTLAPLPTIVCCRPQWAGGHYVGDENGRLEILQLATDLGAEYVDVELEVAVEFSANLKKKNRNNCKLIVSYHNNEMSLTAEDLGGLATKIQEAGADIIKIVSIANNITDCYPMLQFLACSKIPTILLATGERGKINQLLCPKFGGFLTSCTFDSNKKSGSSQLTLSEVTKVYQAGRVNKDTEVFGLISCPVHHSKGPIIHNAAFSETSYNGIYLPFLVDNLEQFFSTYNDFKFSGFSVGIPYKADALKFCDVLDSTAQAIGAVNTIIRRKSDGKLIGYNTDCEAAISAIEDGLACALGHAGTKVNVLLDKLVVVLGSGGAGKAIAFGAKQRGARVVVTDYAFERAKDLADALGGQAIPLDTLDDFCPESGMILANACPVGMYPDVDKTPIHKKALKYYSLVFDAIYNPGKTRLLTEAAESGAAVVSGLEMFIRQATAQFELFTGQQAPEEIYRRIISSFQTS